MDKEDAIKFRANTNNKGYGFEQKTAASGAAIGIKKQVTQEADTPYEYNFRAQGNY